MFDSVVLSGYNELDYEIHLKLTHSPTPIPGMCAFVESLTFWGLYYSRYVHGKNWGWGIFFQYMGDYTLGIVVTWPEAQGGR